jgi:hypothetical protein
MLLLCRLATIAISPRCRQLTRIIHQPAKSASERTCGGKMRPISILAPGPHAPQTNSSGPPWRPPHRSHGRAQASDILAALRGVQHPLGHWSRPARPARRVLRGQASTRHPGQRGPQQRRSWARRGQGHREPSGTLLPPGTACAQRPRERCHGGPSPRGRLEPRAAPGLTEDVGGQM